MKKVVLILITLTTFCGFAQKKDKALEQSNNYVYQANELVNEDFAMAEMEYRKAISMKPTNVVGAYNLGNTYYKNQKFGEALLRHQEVIKLATTKEEKHKAYHNMGNTLMQGKQCKEAVEAFKNALRNNPNDDETRYNLALAKKCAEEQGGGGEDENQDQNQDQKEDQEKEDNKEKQDEGDQKEDNEDEGDQDQEDGEDKGENDGEDKEDEDGNPKDEKKDQGKDDKKEQPKPQQGQLSPQQIKNLLEAMNDQEQQVQEKMNAQKAQGVKVESDKDW